MSAACTLAAPGGAHLLPSSADPRGSDSSGPAPWDQASIDAVVDAAEMEDWGVVADALADGFPINTGHSQTGYTTLHHAAFYADPAAVQLALSCGADPRVRSDNGRTAVCYAARHGSAEVMAMLLAAKGDVNTVACCGRTPLIVLCLAGYGDAPARLRLLLDQPHLNLAVTFEGRGPAEWAREGGREDLAVMVEEEVAARGRWSPLRQAWVGAVVRGGHRRAALELPGNMPVGLALWDALWVHAQPGGPLSPRARPCITLGSLDGCGVSAGRRYSGGGAGGVERCWGPTVGSPARSAAPSWSQ